MKKQINYIVFDVNGKLRKSNIGHIVATSDNQKVFVFNDADTTTEESSFRAFARIKRADNFVEGPLTLNQSEITTENTDMSEVELNQFLTDIGVDYTTCRILSLSKKALAISGSISITVVFDRVDGLGKVIETQAKAEVTAHVYKAVEEIFTEEEYNEIKEEMLPRDLGDITIGSELSGTETLLGRQSGATKKLSVNSLKNYFEKFNVINLGEIDNPDTFADTITNRGVYRYEYDDGPFGFAGLLFHAIYDDEVEQIKIERNKILYRFKTGISWSAWNELDLSKKYIKTDGTVEMEAALDLNNNKIINVANGINNTDAVNKKQLDDSINTTIKRDGSNAMQGNLNMGNHKIINVDAGVNANDAVNKSQLDLKVDTAKLLDGTIVVDRAVKDRLGRVIDEEYATISDLNAHNNDNTAHFYIRALIAALEREIQRLDGRGKSLGEIPYTTAYLHGLDIATRNTTIVNAIRALDFNPSDYNPSVGDLVYDLGTGNGVGYHEWEFNGTNWVDNGLIGFAQATNDVFGLVKGDGVNTNILNGIIEIIKSTYASRLGSSENYLTYDNVINEINNRYTKNEIDYMIDQLKTIYGFEDSLIGELYNRLIKVYYDNNKIYSDELALHEVTPFVGEFYYVISGNAYVNKVIIWNGSTFEEYIGNDYENVIPINEVIEYDFVIAQHESWSGAILYESIIFEPKEHGGIIRLNEEGSQYIIVEEEGYKVYGIGDNAKITLIGIKTKINDILLTKLDVSVFNEEMNKLVNGETVVGKAEIANRADVSELAYALKGDRDTVEDVFNDRITATDINEIEDATIAVIEKIEGQTIIQRLENAHEDERLTTESLVNIFGETIIEDNVIKNSNPTQIISKSSNLFNNTKGSFSGDDYIITETGFIRQAGKSTEITYEIDTISNQEYTLSMLKDEGNRVYIIDVATNTTIFVSTTTSTTVSITFTALGNKTLLRFNTQSAYRENATEWSNIMLNEGTEALPYQPYTTTDVELPDLSIHFPYGMCSLPNGVRDELGIKRVGKINLWDTNTSTFTSDSSGHTTNFYSIYISNITNYKLQGDFLINIPNAIRYSTLTAYRNADELAVYTSSSNAYIYLKLPKTHVNSVADARNYCLTNNVVLYYEYNSPIITGISPIQVPVYDNGNIVLLDDDDLETLGETQVIPKYKVRCEANKDYFFSCKLTDGTGARITNGSVNYFLSDGFIKFKPTTTEEYWLECVKDGVNKISRPQWFELNGLDKTSSELYAILSKKFYQFGIHNSNVSELISTGDNWYNGEYSEVLPNTAYKVIGNSYTITLYDIDKVEITTTQSNSFTTPHNCFYVTSDNESIGLYLATNPTVDYKSYTVDKIDIPEVELCSLPNGVRDELTTRRVGKIIFTGNENWGIFSYNTLLNNTVVFFTSSTIDIPNIAVGASYLNNLGYVVKYIPLDVNYNLTDSEGITLNASSPNKLRIQISKSKLDGYSEALSNTEKINLFKAYLSNNPLTIIYQLAQPEIVEIPYWDNQYVAYNYGRESLDSIAKLSIGYYRDYKKQIKTLSDIVQQILNKYPLD